MDEWTEEELEVNLTKGGKASVYLFGIYTLDQLKEYVSLMEAKVEKQKEDRHA